MFRTMLCSLVMLAVCVGFAAADKEKTDAKNKFDKKAKEAKITKVDAKKGTVTATVKSKDEEVEKTYKLAEEIEYMDSTGKVATIEIFTSGDQVLIVEVDGKITKMKKQEKEKTPKKPESK